MTKALQQSFNKARLVWAYCSQPSRSPYCMISEGSWRDCADAQTRQSLSHVNCEMPTIPFSQKMANSSFVISDLMKTIKLINNVQ